jgi:uncharacterized protein (TIGR03089 family)
MTAATLPELLSARMRTDAAGPLVTFYDDATGERTELSTATFANWVAKSANLLVDGLGLGPGDTAALDLPVHWQSLVVVAACAAVGLTVGWEGPAAVAFTAEGGAAPTGDEVVRLSLRPLGAGLAEPDPAVTDYAAEVRTYGDRFTGPAPRVPTFAGLLSTAGDARRVLLAPAGDPPLDEPLLLAAYVRPLLAGGSVVLSRHTDRALLARRAASERAETLDLSV